MPYRETVLPPSCPGPFLDRALRWTLLMTLAVWTPTARSAGEEADPAAVETVPGDATAAVERETSRERALGELGMAAPPLEILHWIQGEPIDLNSGKGKTVYVVEFWATWCGPCLASIPHLDRLQKNRAGDGVRVVGITDEMDPEGVAGFVHEMSETMRYTVAVDDRGKTGAAYMGAFGESRIPHAFIVDREGRIAWRGHPRGGLEEVLGAILAGTYDLEAVRREEARERRRVELVNSYFQSVILGENLEEADAAGEAILRNASEDASFLDDFAWTILTHVEIRSRDIDLALRSVERAHRLTGGADPSVLDTYGFALFKADRIEEAVRYAEKAVSLSPNDQVRSKYEERLVRYREEARTSEK